MLSALPASIVDNANLAAMTFMPILAQSDEEAERGYSIEVALILFCIVLGMIVALRPGKRTTDFKKPREQG